MGNFHTIMCMTETCCSVCVLYFTV